MIMAIVGIIVGVVFVEGLVLVKDAAFFGALLLEELVIDGAFLPCHLLLPAVESQSEGLRLLLLVLGRRGRGWRGMM